MAASRDRRGLKDEAFEVLIWLLMPLVLGSMWAVVDLIWTLAKRIWTGSWSFVTLGDAFATAGVHIDHRFSSWPFSVVVLLLTLAAFGSAGESSQSPTAPVIQEERKPMRLPRFLWPKAPHPETTVLIRLGRTIHWVAVFAAAGAFALSVVLGWDSVTHAAQSRENARQWDIAHPNGRPSTNAIYDERPYVADDFLGTALLVGAAAALGIALSGRGIRYILAGE